MVIAVLRITHTNDVQVYYNLDLVLKFVGKSLAMLHRTTFYIDDVNDATIHLCMC